MLSARAEAARQRKEKLLARGGDRLAAITGGNNSAAAVLLARTPPAAEDPEPLATALASAVGFPGVAGERREAGQTGPVGSPLAAQRSESEDGQPEATAPAGEGRPTVVPSSSSSPAPAPGSASATRVASEDRPTTTGRPLTAPRTAGGKAMLASAAQAAAGTPSPSAQPAGIPFVGQWGPRKSAASTLRATALPRLALALLAAVAAAHCSGEESPLLQAWAAAALEPCCPPGPPLLNFLILEVLLLGSVWLLLHHSGPALIQQGLLRGPEAPAERPSMLWSALGRMLPGLQDNMATLSLASAAWQAALQDCAVFLVLLLVLAGNDTFLPETLHSAAS
mmetsp:Transcript_29505/g.83220  ORF Transcript_29505/g.83220 Transcript_29505/m.83220 type:complete len:338 (+) Transcript_29505:88-1101(+)